MTSDTAFEIGYAALLLPSSLLLVFGTAFAGVMAARGHRGASAVAAAASLALLAELTVVAIWRLPELAGVDIEYQSAPFFAIQGIVLAVSAAGPTLLALSALWGRGD